MFRSLPSFLPSAPAPLLSRLSSCKPICGYFSGTVRLNDHLDDADADADADAFPSINPSTGSTLSVFSSPSLEMIDAQLSLSSAAYEKWSSLPVAKRGAILHRFGSLVETKYCDELASLISLDVGIPVNQTVDNHVIPTAAILKYYGDLAQSSLPNPLTKPEVEVASPHLPSEAFVTSRLTPLGVTLGITPWNYPTYSLASKLGPSLAVGNAYWEKPSPCSPLPSLLLAEIFTEASDGDFPGLFNVVQGGEDIAQYLLGHPIIMKTSITGSTRAGRAVLEGSAKNVKPATLELGGKSPLIVRDDCDLERALEVTMNGNFFNNGQVCSNCTRVYVEAGIFEEFVGALKQRVENLKIGSAADSNTNIGPIVSEKQYESVKGHIDAALKDSKNTLLTGGGAWKREGGCYVEPTVFLCDSDDSDIVREEVFGPVVSVLRFHELDDVINRCNASIYGLGAGIVTRDLPLARSIASRLHCGNVWINSYNGVVPEMMFGGVKMSGFGREGGIESLKEWTYSKTVWSEEHKAFNVDNNEDSYFPR